MYIFLKLWLLCYVLPVFRSLAGNVGTVLFTTSDNLRKCWSDEEVATLTSRMFFEDILPCEKLIDIQDDTFIVTLIDYFKMVVRVVRSASEGKTKHVLLTSLADCLGGYLHHTALPLARHAFYSGNINYESIAELYELYDELKQFLRTDGRTWAPPITDFSQYTNVIRRIPMLTDASGLRPCEDLIYYENPVYGDQIYIPMPFFDTKLRPHTIAVPFKNSSLRNIQEKGAAFVIVKFFMSAMSCLTSRKTDKISILNFYKHMDRFLRKDVFVHLQDDKFYSAFGGVMRIKKTLESLEEINGLSVSTSKEVKPKLKYSVTTVNTFVPLVSRLSHKFMKLNFKRNHRKTGRDTKRRGNKKQCYPPNPPCGVTRSRCGVEPTKSSKTKLGEFSKGMIIMMVLILILLLWLSIGILYLCYRMLGMPFKCGRKWKGFKVKSKCTIKNKPEICASIASITSKHTEKKKKKRSKSQGRSWCSKTSLETDSRKHKERKERSKSSRSSNLCESRRGCPCPSPREEELRRCTFKQGEVFGYDYNTSSPESSPRRSTSPSSKSSRTTSSRKRVNWMGKRSRRD